MLAAGTSAIRRLPFWRGEGGRVYPGRDMRLMTPTHRRLLTLGLLTVAGVVRLPACARGARGGHEEVRRDPITFRPARSGRRITLISALFFVIAVCTASATCCGVTSAANGFALRPVSAHIPAWLTNVGEIAETPTPVPHSSSRSASAKPRMPNLVAL